MAALAAAAATVTPDALQQLQERYPEEDARKLFALCASKKGDVEATAALYEEFRAWRDALGPVRIEDIEANLRAGGGKGPFMLTLDGYPAGTDPSARVPIIMLQGMIKGTRDEMVKQVVYTAERAWEMIKDSDPSKPLPKFKFLINARGGGFRPPDKDYRAAVFDILGKYYPWLASCNVIFLDVPRIVRGALWAVGKLMTSTGGAAWDELLRVAETKNWPEGVDDAVAAYAAAVPPERALKFADGQVSFDMEGYIQERKAAEAQPQQEPQPSKEGGAGAKDVVAGITAGLAGAAISLEG